MLCSKMQTEFENMLRNLNVVALLMPNDKLNTEQSLFSVYNPTAIRGVVRYLYSENRESNISKIQSCMQKAMTFITFKMDNQIPEESYSTRIQAITERQHCIRIIACLEAAQHGLLNLCQTYRDDASIVAKIYMLKHEIDDFLQANASSSTNSCLTLSNPT